MSNPHELKLSAFLSSIHARIESLPRWVPPALITSLVSLCAVTFLWPAPLEFPMDDSYIHMVYAQNLAEHGKIFFSFPKEVGVASSSILWAGLLALGYKLGFSMYLVAKALGIGSLIAVGCGIYSLMRQVWDTTSALAAALLISLSGNMIWFSLSGMETMLFLAIAVNALLLYRAGRWGGFGVLAGLLTLTRPEGLMLLVACITLEIFGRRAAWRGVILSAVLCVIICLPWFIYLKVRTDHFLPTSAAAKQLSSAQAMGYLIQTYHLPLDAEELAVIIFPALWMIYILEFALGGVSLPGPRYTFPNLPGNTGMSVSYLAVLGFVIFVVLFYHGARRFLRFAHVAEWMRDPAHRAILALVLWAALHNLAYLILLPIPGTASRYGAVNYIILWIGFVAGFSRLVRKPLTQELLIVFIILVSLSNTVYWSKVYDANLEHMLNVRIPAAYYMRDNFPASEQCAAFDIGVIRYFSGRPIVEVAALLEPKANDWLSRGAVDEYLLSRNASCLILPGPSQSDADNIIDFADLLGIRNSPLFELHPVQRFEIHRERWLLGYLPTGNYQPSVIVYKLIPRK